jgi:hypothetical protein
VGLRERLSDQSCVFKFLEVASQPILPSSPPKSHGGCAVPPLILPQFRPLAPACACCH